MATRRRHDDIEPYMVEATYRLASGNVENKELGMILPHEILHLIWSKAPNFFMQRFIGPHGEIGLREFWEHCVGEPWLQNHEYKQLVEAHARNAFRSSFTATTHQSPNAAAAMSF